jgi:thymidylate kinase
VSSRTGQWAPVVLDGASHGLPGRLLSIEGSDGSGKSHFVDWLTATVGDVVPCTHVLMPGEYLRDYPYWRAWNDESLGIDPGRISGLGLSVMAVGDRLVRQKAVIEPALRRGHLVICERYALTPLVFNSGALMSEPLRHLPRPDLGLLFDAPSDVLFDRVAGRSGNAVHPQTRQDKNLEVERFRLLAGANRYTVVDTGTPNDYAELKPLLGQLLPNHTKDHTKESHADVWR